MFRLRRDFSRDGQGHGRRCSPITTGMAFQTCLSRTIIAQTSSFHNIGGKRFEEVAFQAGVAYNDEGAALAGMGRLSGREQRWLTRHLAHRDRKRDVSVVYQRRQRSISQCEPGKPDWEPDEADVWVVKRHCRSGQRWVEGFVVARSNVMDNIGEISRHFRYAEPNSVLRNRGNGQFEDVSASAGADFIRPAPHRGLAFGDLDNDGRMDLVVTALGAPVRVFRNVTESRNHWILLKLVGTKSNRMGLGARIRVTTEDGRMQYNEATTSTGYAASSDPRVHFGLGSSRMIKEIEIRWPSASSVVT